MVAVLASIKPDCWHESADLVESTPIPEYYRGWSIGLLPDGGTVTNGIEHWYYNGLILAKLGHIYQCRQFIDQVEADQPRLNIPQDRWFGSEAEGIAGDFHLRIRGWDFYLIRSDGEIIGARLQSILCYQVFHQSETHPQIGYDPDWWVEQAKLFLSLEKKNSSQKLEKKPKTINRNNSNTTRSILWQKGDVGFVEINGIEKEFRILGKTRETAIAEINGKAIALPYNRLQKHSNNQTSWLLDRVRWFFPNPLIPTELGDWVADYIIVEPPLKEVEAWLTQLENGAVKGAIAILPIRPDCNWWEKVYGDICFVQELQNRQPYCVVYVGEESDRFVSCFSSLGIIWRGVK